MNIKHPDKEYRNEIIAYSSSIVKRMEDREMFTSETEEFRQFCSANDLGGACSFEYGFVCGYKWHYTHFNCKKMQNLISVMVYANEHKNDDNVHDYYHDCVLYDSRHCGSWDYGFFCGVEYALAQQ